MFKNIFNSKFSPPHTICCRFSSSSVICRFLGSPSILWYYLGPNVMHSEWEKILGRTGLINFLWEIKK